MKKLLTFISLIICGITNITAQQFAYRLSLKPPGNPADSYELQATPSGELKANKPLPLKITQKKSDNGSYKQIHVTIEATETVYYNFEERYELNQVNHNDCQFYMPGFWYRHNLRSPKEAPSFHTSDSWQVREDRLSTPLTGIFNEKTGNYYIVLRLDEFARESLTTHQAGEVILGGKHLLVLQGSKI